MIVERAVAAVTSADGVRAESDLIDSRAGAPALEIEWRRAGGSFELRLGGVTVWRLDR